MISRFRSLMCAGGIDRCGMREHRLDLGGARVYDALKAAPGVDDDV
jgi:hypothetical protein